MDPSNPTLPRNIRALADLEPDELADAMRQGGLQVEIEGALSEWGSRLELLVTKLERSVMEWHEPGKTRTLTVTFVEDVEEAATGDE